MVDMLCAEEMGRDDDMRDFGKDQIMAMQLHLSNFETARPMGCYGVSHSEYLLRVG